MTDFNLPPTYSDPSDLIAVRRGDLIKLVRAASRGVGCAKFSDEPGFALGCMNFVHDELLALSERPPVCQYCHADGEYPGGVCADHFEDACGQRRADVLEASGVRF